LAIISSIGTLCSHLDVANAFSASWFAGNKSGTQLLQGGSNAKRQLWQLPSMGSSTALCAGPNPFVNYDNSDGESEGDGGFFPPTSESVSESGSIGEQPQAFGFTPENNSVGEDSDISEAAELNGNQGLSPNPFLQPKPTMVSANNPFGGGPSSSGSGTSSGPPASPFGANGNGFATSGDGQSSDGPNPFLQPKQPTETQAQMQPAAANPFGSGAEAVSSAQMPQPSANGGSVESDTPSPSTLNMGFSGGALSQSPFGQSQDSSGEQLNNSPFGGGQPLMQDANAMGSPPAMPSTFSQSNAAAAPPSSAPSMPTDNDTWVEFSIHPGHVPDPAFMVTVSTDYSNAIPRGLVLRTMKPGMRFGKIMTQKADVVVSLGEEPVGSGSDDDEEPEKQWDLGPGEYVVNRGTRLDKTRMYVMDFVPSTTREGGTVLRTVNPGIMDEWGNNVRLAEVIVSGGPDGKWREPKPQMEGMEGVVGGGMMDGRGGAMGGVDGGSQRVSRGFVAFSSGGSLGPARRGNDGQGGGGDDGYTYGATPETGGDPYSLW